MIKRILLLMLIAGSMQAATYTWTGTSSTNWQENGNWDIAGWPDAQDDVAICTAGSAGPNLTGTVTIASLTHNSSHFTADNGGLIIWDSSTGTGTYSWAAGNFAGCQTDWRVDVDLRMSFVGSAYYRSDFVGGSGNVYLDSTPLRWYANSSAGWSGEFFAIQPIANILNGGAYGTNKVHFCNGGTQASGTSDINAPQETIICADFSYTGNNGASHSAWVTAAGEKFILRGTNVLYQISVNNAAVNRGVEIAGDIIDEGNNAGMWKVGAGDFRLLGGTPVFTGDFLHDGGDLSFEASGVIPAINLVLSGTNTPNLYIEAVDCINDSAIMRVNTGSGGVDYPNIYFTAPATNETINELWIDGVQQAIGTYGATGSGADNIDDDLFANANGVLNVTNGVAAPTGDGFHFEFSEITDLGGGYYSLLNYERE